MYKPLGSQCQGRAGLPDDGLLQIHEAKATLVLSGHCELAFIRQSICSTKSLMLVASSNPMSALHSAFLWLSQGAATGYSHMPLW